MKLHGLNCTRTKLQVALAAVFLWGAAGSAQAQNVGQCIKQTASCAGKVAATSVAALDAAGSVLEFAASNANCVADMVAQNYITIGISGAITTLAATGVVKKEGGSYYKGLYGPAARPVIEGVASIVPVPVLADLLRDNGDDAIGAAFQAAASGIPIPSAGAPNLDMQLQCGAAVAGAGMQMIGDVRRVVGQAKAAVKSCSAAANCFKDVLVSIVKDPVGAVGSAGEFIADTADDVLDAILPSCKNPSVESYFAANFKPQVNTIAWELAWGDPNFYGPVSQYLVNTCVKFFDDCDSDPDTAKRQCVVMSSGAVQTDGNGWIAGKGLEQLVRTRELELAIPKMLAVEAKWADAQQKPRIDKLVAALYGDVPPEMKSWLMLTPQMLGSQGSVRAMAVRKILGVNRPDGKFGRDEKVTAPPSSIAALMQGFVPVEGPKPGLGSYKAGQIYKQYYPDSGNEKLLKQIDAEGEKQLVKWKSELIAVNGVNWNREYAKLHADKIRARAAQCKNADKKCVDEINGIALLREVSLRGMGAVENYAGTGAWGLQHPAHLKYLANFNDAMSDAGKAIVKSQLVVMTDPSTQAAGMVLGAPTAPGAGGASAAVSKPAQSMTQMPGLPGVPGGPAAPTSPLPNMPPVAVAPNTARAPTGLPALPGMAPSTPAAPPKVGMPALPGMGGSIGNTPPRSGPAVNAAVAAAVAGAAASGNAGKTAPVVVANTPVTPQSTPVNTPNSALVPGAVPGVVPPAPAPAAPAPSAMVALNNSPPITQSVPVVPPPLPPKPFDEQTYERERETSLNAKWIALCPATGTCKQQIPVLTNKQVDAEIAAIKSNNPNHNNKVAVLQLQQQTDAKFEAQYRAALVPPPAMVVMPDPAANVGNKPVTVPKGVPSIPKLGK